MDFYVNGGFVGVVKTQKAFVEVWQRIISLMGSLDINLNKLSQGDRTLPFCFPDQDALNIACMAYSGDLSAVGADGMDFQWGGGGRIMSHAAGGIKPWRKRFLLTLLTKFQRPSIADHGFVANLDGPLYPFQPARLREIKLDLFLTRAFGRFIGR
jgi:hypothetical protein